MFAVMNCRLHIFRFYLGSQVIEVQALGVEGKAGTQGPCVGADQTGGLGPFLRDASLLRREVWEGNP